MTPPKVSIIIATYNSSAIIAKTLDSIFQQTYTPFEIIAVDDASTDDTPALLQSYVVRYPHIFRYFQNEKNIGAARTYHRLLTLANGKYVNNLNHDDYFQDKNKLASQVAFLESRPEYVLIGTWATLLFPDGSHFQRRSKTTDQDLRRSLYGGTNPFVHSTVLFRRETALAVGGYSLQYAKSNTEDLDLWLALGTCGKMACLNSPTTAYTISENAISSHRRWQQAIDVIKVLHRYHTNYTQSFTWYPWQIAKIAARQILSALFPRTFIMKLKYRNK
ncbi:MAG: glycosyltransferase [Patescibacteria group bacterium]|jgi:glycosyltransferase involved in cell wall biosynthesis